ncbi:MAG: hypothetical protein ABEJ58_01800 [Halodesulfurarchaeum sp.]
MNGLLLYLLVVKGVTLFAGGAIIYYTIRAAQRTGDRGLWLLAFGLVGAGLGILFSGLLPMILPVNTVLGLAITGTFSAIGLVIIVVSMASDVPVPHNQ